MARKENPLKKAKRQVDDIDTIIFDSIGGPGAPGNDCAGVHRHYDAETLRQNEEKEAKEEVMPKHTASEKRKNPFKALIKASPALSFTAKILKRVKKRVKPKTVVFETTSRGPAKEK